MGDYLIICGCVLLVLTIFLAIYYKKKPLIYKKTDLVISHDDKTEIMRNGYVTSDIKEESETSKVPSEELNETELIVSANEETEFLANDQTEVLTKDLDKTEIIK